ncbi:WD40-repeat-containing domain protein [Phascolomyces articulosus]|uniref:WD40-repeat-containing domain protein n=1 Tax=Phascolomyces articulosus TaxID=60185 RepID=A0AAD5KJN7_9FUNG|nr:WD40-repeat-containing domain protein [Phascolomyces articulosus]
MEHSSDDGMFYDAKNSTATIKPVPKTHPSSLHNGEMDNDDDNDVTNNATESHTTIKVHRNSITVGPDWRTSESPSRHDNNNNSSNGNNMDVTTTTTIVNRTSQSIESSQQQQQHPLELAIPPSQPPRTLRSQKSILSIRNSGNKNTNHHSNNNNESRQNEHQASDKKAKKSFLERIGLRRRKKTNESNKEDDDPHATTMSAHIAADDDDISEHTTGTTSSSESTAARNSTESTRSGTTQMPNALGNLRDHVPHIGLPVKVKSKNKASHELSRLCLAQTLTLLPRSTNTSQARRPSHDTQEHSNSQSFAHGATWTMMFSKDGKFMATAGQYCNIHVWKVLDHESNSDSIEDETIHVFEETPIREYRGHLADILDISWSKNNFIVSASMDKTVRLWHVSREECLGVFPHLDIVTSVCFHPKDDRFFLSGSLDSRLRLWSIADKKVSFWNEVPNGNLITAVGFTLDGKTSCAGSQIGQCFFYETQGLRYNTQINIRFSKRTSKKGRKITGIEAMPGMLPGEEKMLITSNDSRTRLYNMRDKSLMYKYKGTQNHSMQIRATFSDDGRNIVCGSEDGNVYIWVTEPITYSPFHHWQGTEVALSQFNTHDDIIKTSGINGGSQHHYGTTSSTSTRVPGWLKRNSEKQGDKLRGHSEYFEAHQHIATVATFAPTRTRQALAKSGLDTIYNHTPIDPALESLRQRRWKPKNQEEVRLMRRSFSGNDFASSHLHPHHHRLLFGHSGSGGKDQFNNDEEDGIDGGEGEEEDESEEEEDWWTELRDKYSYPDGHIIVSANDTGCIKVWRMDTGVYDELVLQKQKRSRNLHRKSNSLDYFVNHHHPPSTTSHRSNESSKTRTRPHLGHLFSTAGRSK